MRPLSCSQFSKHLESSFRFWIGVACTLVLWVIRLGAAEVEPNNSRLQANQVILNSSGQATINGRIGSLSDLDFFSVSVPPLAGPGTFLITMTPTSQDHALDARVQLQSATGVLLADKDARSDDVTETLTYPSVSGNATYYIVCLSARRRGLHAPRRASCAEAELGFLSTLGMVGQTRGLDTRRHHD